MSRFVVPAVGLIVVVSAGVASAQPRPPVTNRTPTFSPYLNLLRGGTNPAVNYYGIVRPQLQFMQTTQLLEQQIYQNSQAVQQLGTAGLMQQQPTLPTTGHPIVFNSYGGYFNNLSAGGGTTGGSTAAFVNRPLPGYLSGTAATGAAPAGNSPSSPYGGAAPGFAPRPAATAPAVGPAPKPTTPAPGNGPTPSTPTPGNGPTN